MGGMFWRLLLGTVAMLTFGYAGETQTVAPVAGFVLGMCGWGFILFEIFAGEAGKVARTGVSANMGASFGTMRFIVSVGWSIYPLGYFFGYLMGGVADCTLNLVYNLADFVNKIAFCLAIWGRCCRLHSELGLQPCRLCEQDCILPCHLGICKEGHRGEGRHGSTSVAMSRWEFWKFFCGFSHI